jgi:hypothetical protein
LVGYSKGKIENCANLGVAVKGTALYSGGIVARVDGSTGSVKNSYNKASITCNRGGGIVGYFASSSTITGCFNTGALTGIGPVAGIVGYVNKSTAVISGCYHAGTTNYNSSGTAAIVSILANNNITIRGCYGDKSIVNPESPLTERKIWGMYESGSFTTVTVEDSYLVTTAELQNSASLAILNEHSTNAYIQDTKSVNGGYPILTWMDNGPLTSVKDTYAGEDNLSITRSSEGALKISVKQPMQVLVYSVAGTLVRSIFVKNEVALQLEKGIYIVNNKKVVL